MTTYKYEGGATCPFCGSDHLKTMVISINQTNFSKWRVMCWSCGAIGPIGKTPNQAEQQWEGRETLTPDATYAILSLSGDADGSN